MGWIEENWSAEARQEMTRALDDFSPEQLRIILRIALSEERYDNLVTALVAPIRATMEINAEKLQHS